MAEEEFSAAFGPLPEGTLLGDYRLDGFTAFSSAGEVYSATDQKTQKSCSILVISSAVSGSSPDVAARLLKNAQKSCFFRHKNFFSILGAFSFSGFRCIVTEPVCGKNIGELMERQEELPLSAEKIAVETAKVLAAAEKSRDLAFEINPDDIFITPAGEVKLLHPGLGSLLHLLSGNALLQEPRLRRNALFIAPEYLLGNSQNSFSGSVYALGALLYLMLSGHPPYQGKNHCASLAKVLEGTLDTSDIPRNAGVIRRLMDKDPSKRINSGRELLRTMGARSGKRTFLCAAALLLVCAVAGAVVTKYVRKNAAGAEKKIVQQLPVSAPAVSPSKKKAAHSPARPQRSVKVTPRPPQQKRPVIRQNAPPYLALRRLSPVPRRPLDQTLEQRISFSRSRLKQLEDDLLRKKVAPCLMKLHKERIEFRKKQVLLLTDRRRLLSRQMTQEQELSELPVNKKLRNDVEGYFAPCKHPNDFMRYRHLVRSGRGQPFPVSELKRSGVDFNMVFDFPAVPHSAALYPVKNGKRQTTLALLMLNGFMMPPADALALLADGNKPLSGIPSNILHSFAANSKIPERHIRYLVNAVSWERFPRMASLLTRNFVSRPANKALLEELLLQGFILPPGIVHSAAAADQTGSLTLLLRADAPLEYRDTEGRTPLFSAYLNHSSRCRRLLLEAGADPEAKDKHGKKARDYQPHGELAAAIRRNDLPAARRALADGADINVILSSGDTPLTAACRARNQKMVNFFLEKGADVNQRTGNGRYPLTAAFPFSGDGMPEIFELLLQKGADPSTGLFHRRDISFMHYLCFSAFRKPTAPRFAEIMLKSGKFKTAPRELFNVCRTRSVELFRILVRNWPDLSTPEYNGLLLQALAARMPSDIIRTMIRRKVPMPSRSDLQDMLSRLNDSRISALFPQAAAKTVRRAVPEPIQVRPSHLPRRQFFGFFLHNRKTAEKVMKAIQNNRRNDLEKLLDEGVHPDSIVNGMTLLQHAVAAKSSSLVSCLLNKKADPFKVSPQLRSYPAALAVEKGATLAFFTLAREKIPGNDIHRQILQAILQRNNSGALLRKYLEYQGRDLRQLDFCLLTFAIRQGASDGMLLQLSYVYNNLSHSKHRGVVHQAVFSRCSPAVIRRLLFLKAPVDGRERVSRREGRRVRWYNLTVLEAAERSRTSPAIVRMLRQQGAK